MPIHSCYNFVEKWVKHPSLNIGAGIWEFNFGGERTKTLDMTRHENTDYVENILDEKREADYYESVLLLNVLEHTPFPLKMLKEIYQILKIGGRLIISVPFICPKHDMPHDYWRFTNDGLKSICERAGFKTNFVEFYFECGNESLSYYRGIFFK